MFRSTAGMRSIRQCSACRVIRSSVPFASAIANSSVTPVSVRNSWLGKPFMIVATARSGHTAAELQRVIDEELDRLRRDGPEPRDVQRAILVNQSGAWKLSSMPTYYYWDYSWYQELPK